MEDRGWRSGWLSESLMCYQLIRMERRCRGGGGRRGGRRGVRDKGREKGAEAEERYILDVQSRGVRLAVSIRAGLEMAAAAATSLNLLSFHAQMKNRLCIIPAQEYSYQMMLRQARLLKHTHASLLLYQRHTRTKSSA